MKTPQVQRLEVTLEKSLHCLVHSPLSAETRGILKCAINQLLVLKWGFILATLKKHI